jgi:hypothetical protein
MDKVRALITGPEDTPYYGGCFFFDIFFPQVRQGVEACWGEGYGPQVHACSSRQPAGWPVGRLALLAPHLHPPPAGPPSYLSHKNELCVVLRVCVLADIHKYTLPTMRRRTTPTCLR